HSDDMPPPAALRVPAQAREFARPIAPMSFGAGTPDPTSGHREMPVNRMFFSRISVIPDAPPAARAAGRFDALAAGAGYSKRASRRPSHVFRRPKRAARGTDCPAHQAPLRRRRRHGPAL